LAVGVTLRAHFTAAEEAQLRRLTDQAFDLNRTGYLRDACAAIVNWNERTLPDRLERRATHEQEEHDAV
jgi:hypothetical protein